MFDTYQDIFNKRGQSYHQAMIDFPRARDSEFAAILQQAQIRDGDVICDMPAGGGYLNGYIPQDVKIWHIETSAAFADSVRESDRAKKILCPLHEVPLENGTVDKVISLAGLHHVPEKPAFFREAFRLLRKGGRLCIADGEQGGMVPRFLDGFVSQHNSMEHHGQYLSPATRDDLRAAGFEIVFDAPIRYTWQFRDEQEMGNYCRLMFGLDRAESVEHIVDGIRRDLGYRVSDAGCEMNWELQFITAEKR